MTLARRRARAVDAMASSTARTQRARDVDARSPPLDVDAPPRSARTGVTRRRVMAVVAAGCAPRDDTALLARSDDARDDDARATRARATSATFRSVGGLVLLTLAIGCYAMVLDGARERGDGAPARSARTSSARSPLTSLGVGASEARGTMELVDSFRARAIGNAIRSELEGRPQRVYDIGGENGTEFLEDVMEYVKDDEAGVMRVAHLGGGRDDDGDVGGTEKLLRSLRRARAALKERQEADTAAVGHRKMMMRGKSKADRPVKERSSTTQATRHVKEKGPTPGGTPKKSRHEHLQRVEAMWRDDLISNADFIADYGDHVFQNGQGDSQATREIGVASSLSSKASLEGLNILRRRYYSNSSEDAATPLLGGQRSCKILYFYHIPRTGGGTLLTFFSRLGVDVQRFERSKYAKEGSDLAQLQALDEDEHWKRVTDRVLNPGNHVIAHHVGRSGLLGMEERLASLRKRAKLRRCELKSFTVMREPLLRDMSDVVARNASEPLASNAQARFLLVNAGTKDATSILPARLTSETASLPDVFSTTADLLLRNFDWFFTLEHPKAVVHAVTAFFSVPSEATTASLEASMRHVSDYSRAEAAAVDAVVRAHADAQEADWLDRKLYAWARARETTDISLDSDDSTTRERSIPDVRGFLQSFFL